MQQEPSPTYGPYPGSVIAPNYPHQFSTTSSLLPPPPQPLRPPSSPFNIPPPPPPPPFPAPPPFLAPRPTSSAPSVPNPQEKLSSLHSACPPLTARGGRRPMSPMEATYVCVDGVCTRLEPGTRTVMLVDQPRRNLTGYLMLGVFVMLFCNVCFGLFAVIFAVLAMSEGVGHRTSMQFGETSLCLSVVGIMTTFLILFTMLLVYSPYIV